jgi:hypothetical protein
VSSRRLDVTYLSNSLGIRTDNTGTTEEIHQPVAYHIQDYSALQDVAPQAFQDAIGKSGRGRRLAHRFTRHVSEMAFDNTVPSAVVIEYRHRDYMLTAVRTLLRHLAWPTRSIRAA